MLAGLNLRSQRGCTLYGQFIYIRHGFNQAPETKITISTKPIHPFEENSNREESTSMAYSS